MAAAVVQTFIDMCDPEGLRQFAGADFDWNQPMDDHPPPLCYAICRFLLDSSSQFPIPGKLEVINTILQAGADPMRALPPGQKVKLKSDRDFDARGCSTMQLTCEMYQAAAAMRHEGGRIEALAQFLADVIVLMKQATDPKVPKIVVHEGVVNLWESVREMSSTHNVIFETSDGEVSAHDHILMAASPVLKAMLQSAMKEGKDKRVQVRDSTKCGMTLFVDVLYTSSTCLELQYKTILEAFDLAHRWQVQHATDILAETLKGEIRVESFAEIAEAAVLKAVEPLQRACMEFGTKDKEIQTLLKKNGLPPAVRKLLGKREAEDEPGKPKRRRL
ncbi:klhl36 [Symbiodinium sp. CCMP2456]|nr:klhl36 [Symbiodinium sp. CCMP2456]